MSGNVCSQTYLDTKSLTDNFEIIVDLAAYLVYSILFLQGSLVYLNIKDREEVAGTF